MFRFQDVKSSISNASNGMLCMLGIAWCVWPGWSPCQHSRGVFALQDCIDTQNLQTYWGTLVDLTLKKNRKESTASTQWEAKYHTGLPRHLTLFYINYAVGLSVCDSVVCPQYSTVEFLLWASVKPESPGWCAGDIDIVIGGPPCQGVTGLNRHAVRVDIRDDSRYIDCWYIVHALGFTAARSKLPICSSQKVRCMNCSKRYKACSKFHPAWLIIIIIIIVNIYFYY